MDFSQAVFASGAARTATLVASLLGALAPAALAVDVFSPGELSKPHASLEGMKNCTRCHPQGRQLAQEACLACHEELRGSLAAGRGLHGRLRAAERDCWTCHHEHQGRDYAMVDWGPGGRARFDHARTGTPLRGKHAPVECQKCHDRSLVADPGVRAWLDKQPGRVTYLGAPAACSACHADEHRGQLGRECGKCHDEKGWKPAPGFDHARTAYPLQGRHARVACDKCHPRVEDGAGPGPGAPRHKEFLRYRPVVHAACADCHQKDPHQGKFGSACQRCHTPADWKALVARSGEDRAFHQKTRYPLEGRHAEVECRACHGPFGAEAPLWKGLSFAACSDCHADAHGGQMRRSGPEGGRCDRCHTVAGFQPVSYGAAEHARSRYPLEGAHRTVACSACHQSDPRVGERFSAQARAELKRRGRPVKLSLAVYDVAGDLSRCETCHADPHRPEFAKRGGAAGCAGCHEVASFARARFDHRDTKFPLEGRHLSAACAACHPRGRDGPPRYAGVETACAACHADPHGAQFAASSRERTDCARCHGAEDWKASRFRHEPPFTEYLLTGRHAKVKCEACHAEVKVDGVKVRRWRGLPRSCAGCHADFHKGALKGF